MPKFFCKFLFFAVLLITGWASSAAAQSGTITGTATSTDHQVLPGAPVTLEPGNLSTNANNQGEFTITNVPPGTYTITVTYLGFAPFTSSVTVAAGQMQRVDAVLPVASQNDTVVVTAGRSYGEAEAINEIRAADNVLNMLPAAVIISLPNANIADAVGRLPGVTLERDEGEGKYVQIRGTAPNLSNLTIDGVVVPSPEGGVRQVKLDTIPADLVDSVQINKTLQASMDADAIGGSVNLVTKTAGERPTVSLYGAGGFTNIITKVPVSEFSGTVGQRFGSAKRFGVIVSGGYDYNGRGIDDIEPGPAVVSATDPTPTYTGAAIRQYRFDRERYGIGGSADYKINDSSFIYVKSLYSDFKDNGHRWEYVLATNQPPLPGTAVPTITTERRDGDYLVSNLLVGGNHVFGTSWFDWGVAASHSRLKNPISGGESITTFTFSGTGGNCQYDPAATKDKLKPQFTAACFTEAYDPTNFSIGQIVDSKHGKSDQVNLSAFASAAKGYHLGGHNSTFELGFKIRNGHKFDNSFSNTYTPCLDLTVPACAGKTLAPLPAITESQFLGGFSNPNYYGGAYKFAPNSPSWEKVNTYLAANPNQFAMSTNQGVNPQNFGLVERVTSGYIMNTLDFSRFRLIAGLRIEGTNESSFSADPVTSRLRRNPSSSYIDYLPSASLRVRVDNSSDVKFVYSRALARPDPAFLAGAFQIDTGTQPATVLVGNTALKAEHANNYDLLYERYLSPLGLIQAGFFYKQLSKPVVQTLSNGDPAFCTSILGSSPCFVGTPSNGGSAYVTGVEFAFQQHFTYLPGLLSGLGVSANYSYTTSQATGVNPLRDDKPALLRQAPHTWNISPTYDRGRLSARVGLAYNGANIFQYAFRDLPPATPPLGGVHGPGGDQYLYAHFQVDAQGSFRIRKGLDFQVSGLNLNNAVFGFYNGSPQYVVQREFYKPTFMFGFRWNLLKE